MTDSKLQNVLDVIDIETVKAVYCEYTDLTPKDAATAAVHLAKVFTDDVVGNYGALGVFKGRAAVVDFLAKDIGGTTNWMWHSIHSPRIEVTGDRAVANWTIVARLIWKKTPDKTETLIGRYADEFRRTPDGWRISALHWIAEA